VSFKNILSYVSNLGYNLKKSALMNKYSPSENRYVAYDYFKEKANKSLAKNKKEEFVEILKLFLERLSISAQNSIKDAEEKEYIKNIILSFDDDIVVDIVKSFIKNSYVIAHAIEILEKKIGRKETLDFLENILSTEDTLFNDPLVDKRIEILKHFDGETHLKTLKKAIHFLSDSDDRLVIASIRFIKNYAFEDKQDTDEVKHKMIEKLIDEQTSTRLRMEILNVFVEQAWKIIDHKKQVEEILPEGYYLNAKSYVRVIKNSVNLGL
jgi:hypothetical protein